MSTCPWCQTTFTPTYVNQIYCKPACRIAYNRSYVCDLREDVCVVCGGVAYVAVSSKPPYFCGQSCRESTYNKCRACGKLIRPTDLMYWGCCSKACVKSLPDDIRFIDTPRTYRALAQVPKPSVPVPSIISSDTKDLISELMQESVPRVVATPRPKNPLTHRVSDLINGGMITQSTDRLIYKAKVDIRYYEGEVMKHPDDPGLIDKLNEARDRLRGLIEQTNDDQGPATDYVS